MRRERVIVNCYGGRIQDVYTDADLDLVIVDWDTGDVSPDEPGIVDVSAEDGRHQFVEVCCGYPTTALGELPSEVASAVSRGDDLVGLQR